MSRVMVCAICGLARLAAAEDALTAHARAEGTREPQWLTFDPPMTALEGLGTREDSARTQIPIGAPILELVGRWRENVDTDEHAAVDLVSRGWSADIRLERRLGPLTVAIHGDVTHVDARFAHATYSDVGLSLGRTFRLSRWMTAWIVLGIGHRTWSHQPPAGESDATTVMLSVGTSF